LAEHFVRSQDAQRAVPYLQQVAEQALQHCAHQEAICLITQALALLATLPRTLERYQQELILQSTLASALIATRGYAALEVAQTYARARDLCRDLGDASTLCRALRGLQAMAPRAAAHTGADGYARVLDTGQSNSSQPRREFDASTHA
jgi:hypothetical protein